MVAQKNIELLKPIDLINFHGLSDVVKFLVISWSHLLAMIMLEEAFHDRGLSLILLLEDVGPNQNTNVLLVGVTEVKLTHPIICETMKKSAGISRLN